jgi:acyl-CoA synthetase (NDP forming)
MTEFERLFYPRAVGIIGINEHRFGGGFFLKSLQTLKYDKPIYLFNPRLKGKEIDGIKVYGSILDLDTDTIIDYVILSVPAKLCPSLLEEIGKKGVPFVTIFTSGFSEVGNDDLEQELLQIAKKNNTRIIGPNCLGVHNPKAKLGIGLLYTPESGRLGLISQSGSISIYMLSIANFICYTYCSKVISIGNQIDLNVIDFLKYFLTDDDTKIIGIYLENLKNQQIGRQFLEITRKLTVSKEKPVILWKVGYGESTKEAIYSHTGGLAGSSNLWEAMAKQSGAILVQGSYELTSLAMAFNFIDLKQINRNLGIVALGGGSSIEVTELMEINNLSIPKLNKETEEKFKMFLPEINTIFRNPLDLGAFGYDAERFSKTLIAIDQDPNVSVIVFVKPRHIDEDFIAAVIKAKTKIKKPLIGITNKINDEIDVFKDVLRLKQELFNVGVPIFESMELAAKALDRMCSYKEFLEKYKNYNLTLANT